MFYEFPRTLSNLVKQVTQTSGMFLYLICFAHSLSLSLSLSLSFSICADPMGEEHHIRRTSGVPPLMVVVSVIVSNDSRYIPPHAVFLHFITDSIK